MGAGNRREALTRPHGIGRGSTTSHTLRDEMRAIVFTGAGGNEVVSLEERATPTPAGDEVLVAVRYAGLNPADIAQRNGHYPARPAHQRISLGSRSRGR